MSLTNVADFLIQECMYKADLGFVLSSLISHET